MPDRPSVIVWFRRDLRLQDNPALFDAVERGATILPVFVWDSESEGPFSPGGASRWWLHHALASLDRSLKKRGSQLILRTGNTHEELTSIARDSGARELHFTRRYEPAVAKHDSRVSEALRGEGFEVRSFDSTLLHDVDSIRTSNGDPYRVFTPFWKRVRSDLRVPEPLPTPRMGKSSAPSRWPHSDHLDDLGLLPHVDWAGGLRESWTVSEEAAQERLHAFADSSLADYPETRDFPDRDGTSRLSPYLHWGMLSPVQVWSSIGRFIDHQARRESADVFLSQIGWREFGYHLLHHFPRTTTEPLRESFAEFEWRDDSDAFDAWKRGRTGFPIVDAGMRQLWATGWMHNRLRMIVASFLTKDLLIPWQKGAAWFWDTLVDADLANNTLGWQWSAGSGADAQPFFRIFNPITQGKKFDPNGEYVRSWVPELANLPNRYLHTPWKVDDGALDGFELGRDYPRPIVDHGEARRRALGAYDQIK